nr:MAG TPA: hypothetical protein [Caudoviricetes sp.]
MLSGHWITPFNLIVNYMILFVNKTFQKYSKKFKITVDILN